jgi:carbon monoxide dehydrogenase subunit G
VPHITETVRIEASKEQVWSVLADFGGVAKFHPGLRGSHATSSQLGQIPLAV